MPENKVGSREEWEAARAELAKLEAEQAERNNEIKDKRRALPWVPVEKEYEFDTQEGKKSLAELFDGRSQLLAYNIMYGPDYEVGACPGCTSLGDEFDGSLVHLNHQDVTFVGFSRAPIDRLNAYKERMGWQFPYVSTYDTDFPFDFGLAMTEEQAQEVPEVKEMIENPPDWLQEWSEQVGADLKDGLREGPGFIAFARDNGTDLLHLPGDGARPVRRPVLLVPARAHAQAAARGPGEHPAEGRVPGLGSVLCAHQRHRQPELGLSADGRDPAARLDGVANRTEVVAEQLGGRLEVPDGERDPPEAGRAILNPRVLNHLQDHLAEAKEPLPQQPVIGLHLTHPPALDPDLIESPGRPVQLRREDD